jgi:hypothetical protein
MLMLMMMMSKDLLSSLSIIATETAFTNFVTQEFTAN